MSRTKAVSRSEYEQIWSEASELVDRRTADASSTSPAELIGRAMYRGKQSPAWIHHYREAGIECGLDTEPPERLVVRHGLYSIEPFGVSLWGEIIAALDDVLQRCPDIGQVVELGSGTGRNLFALYDQRDEYRQLEFVACELTDSGRTLSREMQEAHAPEMRLDVRPFDFYEPDLGFLTTDARALVFTVFAIEQIPVIGSGLFEGLVSRAPVVGMHFEPVGWQSGAEQQRWATNTRMRYTRRRRLLNRLRGEGMRSVELVRGTNNRTRGFAGIRVRRSDVGRSDNVSRNAAAWSVAHDYNMDLLDVLLGLRSAGTIEITDLHINKLGDNPFNPATVIGWRSVD